MMCAVEQLCADVVVFVLSVCSKHSHSNVSRACVELSCYHACFKKKIKIKQISLPVCED